MLDLKSPQLELDYLNGFFTLYQLPIVANVPLPISVINLIVSPSPFFNLTRTPYEISIISNTEIVGVAGIKADGPYRILKVAGPLALELTGILSEITNVLKEAEVPVFASSTFNTDYILIKADRSEEASAVLAKAGWIFKKVVVD
jgi:hypothetical protein